MFENCSIFDIPQQSMIDSDKLLQRLKNRKRILSEAISVVQLKMFAMLYIYSDKCILFI